jgi:acyl-CoA thioesterase-1
MKKDKGAQVTSYKLQVFLILLSCFFILISGCVKREIKNIDSQGKNIICFGDSITFGYGANPGEDWPTILAKELTYPVINAGLDGDTSISALSRFEEDALRKEPLLVIIEMGGNDFIKKIPIETTMKNVAEMAQRAQERGAMVAIADISAGMFLRQYRAEFAKLAKRKNAIFIPGILSGIITNPNLKSDYIHPNAEGYKVIARRVYEKILPYLKRNLLLRQEKKVSAPGLRNTQKAICQISYSLKDYYGNDHKSI